MDKLYDIQEDMEELKEMPMEAVKEEIKYQGKRMKKIIIISLCVVAVLAILFIWNEKRYERDHTKDLIWEQKNFPVMSEMYENQEYEELEEIYLKALYEDRSLWNRGDFCIFIYSIIFTNRM